jgi:beta-glucosidase
VRVSAKITNRGRHEADEIVQLYIRQQTASVARPVRELKNFRRLHLKPGESATVRFEIRPGDLAFYNEQMRLVTEPGKYRFWIAPDSARGLGGEFIVD